MSSPRSAPVVAVVGGGFTGAAVAYHLALSRPEWPAGSIIVVEPRETLGAGLAYSSTEPAHRINVPASRMSIDPDDPASFARWLAAGETLDAEALDANGDVFPQRGVFGRYVADCLAPLQAEDRVRHRRARVESIRCNEGGPFDLALTDGSLRADIVVLATTHPLPAVPPPLRPIAGSPAFLADPYDAGAIERIDRDAQVLVVGNGLTGADVVASLDRLGHRGMIVTLSRNGLRSRTHAPAPVEPFGDFASEPSASALSLLRRVRGAVAEAASRGISWHGVLDAVRLQGTDIWQALSVPERRKLVRHLRAFWDVHRFRIAPQVAGVLDRLTAEKRLRSVAASLVSSEIEGDRLTVSFRPKGGRTVETRGFHVVINTTGPAHRSVVRQQPLQSLFEDGTIALDAVGLGLAVAPDGHALDQAGRVVPRLYVAGPLARGTVGELMGLPQVTAHARFVAAQVAAEELEAEISEPTSNAEAIAS